MASLVLETVYLGRDNTVDLVLKADGVAQDLSPVTQMDLIVGGKTISSSSYPDAFDWTTDGAGGKVYLDLADPIASEGISAGTYVATLVVYDSEHPDGIRWDDFRLRVVG